MATLAIAAVVFFTTPVLAMSDNAYLGEGDALGQMHIDTAGLSSVPFTNELVANINRTADKVISRIRPTERAFLGDNTADVINISQWPNAYGNCRDYAQTIAYYLHKEHGIPYGAMLRVTVSWRGESHELLVVRTDRGDLIAPDQATSGVASTWAYSGWDEYATSFETTENDGHTARPLITRSVSPGI